MLLESSRDEESVDLSLRPPKEELPIDIVLRLLGEYSAKVSSGLRIPIKDLRTVADRNGSSYRRGTLILLTVLNAVAINLYNGSDNIYTSLFFCVNVILAASWVAVGFFWFLQLRTRERKIRREELELAVWQLRRVYQVASRMEDLGRDMDFARQLEFELRLSEAQFLLNRAEKLGIPEATADSEIAGVLRARSKRSGDEEPSAASSERPSQTPSVMTVAESP